MVDLGWWRISGTGKERGKKEAKTKQLERAHRVESEDDLSYVALTCSLQEPDLPAGVTGEQ